jgi:hypothetical protein
MILACVRDLARTGSQAAARPDVRLLRRRGGRRGLRLSHWVVSSTPRAVFDGVERGDQRGRRLQRDGEDRHTGRASGLPPADGREGHRWLRLTRARPRGSRVGAQRRQRHRAARQAIARIDAHVWPREYIASVRGLLDGLSVTHRHCRMPPTTRGPRRPARTLGGAQGFVRGTLRTRQRHDAHAGYKHNVIPQHATPTRLPVPPRARGPLMATIRDWPGNTSRSRSCIGTSPWTHPSPATSSRR